MVLFVKYEFWPNYLSELERTEHSYLTWCQESLEKDQLFFQCYGGWMQRKLNSFSHFFVQDENSRYLLNHWFHKCTVISGDTRFDRVYEILKQRQQLRFCSKHLVGDSYVLVAGSTWQEDEDLLVNYIMSQMHSAEKIIIAPHNIKTEALQLLKEELGKKVVLYSEKDGKKLEDYQVLVVDTIGLLTKIYSLCRCGLCRWRLYKKWHTQYIGAGNLWNSQL